MKSAVKKRSVDLAKHKTSVSLEAEFWDRLREIAAIRHVSVSKLVQDIDNTRAQGNLSSAIRVFVLDECLNAHLRAPHDSGHAKQSAFFD